MLADCALQSERERLIGEPVCDLARHCGNLTQLVPAVLCGNAGVDALRRAGSSQLRSRSRDAERPDVRSHGGP
jgi:hypothetical protein